MTGRDQLSFFPEAQLEMFAAEELRPPRVEMPPEFVAMVRDELLATLETARRAERLPWPDLTRATLAELRFRSMSRYLPDDEAAALWAAFDAELDRLHAAEEAAVEG